MAKFLSELHDIKDQALLLSLCPFTEYNLQVVFSGCREARSNFSMKSRSPHCGQKGMNLAEILGSSCPGNGKGVVVEGKTFSAKFTQEHKCCKSEYAIPTKSRN